MAWHETPERLRIIREVEAYAVCDQSGRLPWRESWSAHFGDRSGLLDALRRRWEPPPLSDQRVRRTQAGVLRILCADQVG